jgi:O-antigen/teichoic acid export membrane protein
MTAHRASLVNIAMLYAGKTSGVLVAFVFLPLYSRLLGPEQFGVVAVILSLQALLLMMDLGMSTLASRDIAVAQTDPTAVVRLINTAETSLTAFYALILVAASMAKALGAFQSTSWDLVIGTVLLFWLVVVQNLYYSATLATQDFKTATVIQVAGALSRAVLSWYLLDQYEKTISTFVWAQVFVAFIHALLGRQYLIWKQKPNSVARLKKLQITAKDCFALLTRGKSILISGVAGAAAMQLDKPILSVFMPPSDIAPYFLATVLSATPVAILAGPIVQFFQPRILFNISTDNEAAYLKNLRYFFGAILSFVIVPVVFLFIYCREIVGLWLGVAGQIELVSNYSRILLIGYGIASLGYLPYLIVIARQEFAFHAKLSTLITILVLAATALFASIGNIVFVCASYVVYFLIATLGLTWHVKMRSGRLKNT